MGVWVPRARTEDGERVLASFAANHSAGSRAVGGRVTVTNEALYFTPNRLDRLTGAKPLRLDRSTVHGFALSERDSAEAFSGGLRKRLAVQGAGVPYLFVVNAVEQRIAELRELWPKPDTAGDLPE
jgi:hypothetical protein